MKVFSRPHKILPKRLVLLAGICTLLVLAGTGYAQAEEGVLAEAERTSLTFLCPNGLKFANEPVYENGAWNVMIDTAATDWADVVSSGFNDSQYITGFLVWIQPDPQKTAKLFCAGGFSGSQQELRAWLADMQQTPPYMQTSVRANQTSIDLGYYDAASGKFFPETIFPDENRASFVRFQYEDDTYDSRYALVRLSFTSTDPVDVPIPQVTKENLLPDFSGTGYQYQISTGKLTYSNPTDTPKQVTLVTAVRAPGRKQEAAGWEAYAGPFPMNMGQDSGGHRVALLKNELPAQASAFSQSSIISWKDENGLVKARQCLSLIIVHGNPRPWPEYVDELAPFDSNDVKLRVLGHVDGLSVQKKGSILRFTMDAEKLIRQAAEGKKNLTDACLEVQIKPPKGAKYYTGGDVLFGSNNIYGPEAAEAYYRDSTTYTPVEITQPWISFSFPYLEIKSFQRPDGGTMQYFFSAAGGMTSALAGHVHIIRWIGEDDVLLGENYLIYTYDEAALSFKEKALDNEGELTVDFPAPRAVIKGNWGNHHGKVFLQAKRMPSSPNSYYYQLQLEAEDGTVLPIPAGEKCDVYLPYPDGYNRQTAQHLTLTIGHYNSQMQLVEDVFSVKKGNLELTPFGMRLRVSSFSPYVVSWESAPTQEETVVPPQTGDVFPLALVSLCALLALGAAGWLASRYAAR